MRRFSTWIATFSLAAASGLAATGCESRCGEGTIERDGVCVAADQDPDPAECGEGTVLGVSGQCEAEYLPTKCDPDTTTPDETTEPGVTICVGTGVASCESFLPCPGADPNKVTVCGRLYDAQTDQQIRAAAPMILGCDEGGAQDGPCELTITFYDALEFAADPDSATELEPESFRLDDCGRFVAENIPKPKLDFLGIGVDDGDGGDYVNTGVAFAVISAQVEPRQKTYATRVDTDTAWSSALGLDPTLVSRGVFMSIFLHGDDPVAGVRVINEAGTTDTGDDFYFTDVEPLSRNSPDADGPNNDNRTGPNGVALLINSNALNFHTGEGAEPAGCEWPSNYAKSIPDVMFINPRIAHEVGDPETECP
jgi:hypothetical protein